MTATNGVQIIIMMITVMMMMMILIIIIVIIIMIIIIINYIYSFYIYFAYFKNSPPLPSHTRNHSHVQKGRIPSLPLLFGLKSHTSLAYVPYLFPT